MRGVTGSPLLTYDFNSTCQTGARSAAPHALFTSAPFIGHLGPLLLQADELTQRGWRVSVASLEEVRPFVARHPDVAFLSLGPSGIDQRHIDDLRNRITFEPSFVRSTLMILSALKGGWTEVYDRVLNVLQRETPDVLVADLSSTAAISAAETAGVTCVINNPDLLTVLPMLAPAPSVPLLLSGKSRQSIGAFARFVYPLQRAVAMLAAGAIVGRPLNAARRSRGLPRVSIHRWFLEKPVLVNSSFGLEYPRPLPPQVHMVGPMLPATIPSLPLDYTAWLGSGPTVVYVNLGTIARPWRELLQRMARALEGDEFRALWVVPSELRPLLPPTLPPSIRVEPWVPSQLAVLRHPNVRAFISHCGTNSVQESVHAGTPIVGIPLFAAQGDMALRVEDAGIGSWLDKHRFTPEQLHEHVVHACRSGQFRANIALLQSGFARDGGVVRAVDLIEQAAFGRSARLLAQQEYPEGFRNGAS
jgi:UDP:flavonoid glycosyltransferase YjiC (YdhE family)